jgi:eukaryotic-like serine/threonine-protein kinase
VVHCDVKPANIFMVGRTSPKVLDFGIARVGHSSGGQPHSAFAAGSPYYMAPEQLNGGPVDRRCDVYALGAVLYELLSGRKPFSGGTLDDIVDAALHREPVPLGELNRKLPPGLVAIVHRALNKDPAQRFRSARRLSQALRLWSAEQPAPRMSALPFGLGWQHLAMAAVLAGAIGVAAAWWPALQHADSPPAVEASSALPASAAEPASAAATALAAASAAVAETQPAPAVASEAASAPDGAPALAVTAASPTNPQRPAAAPREPKPREARKTTATTAAATTGLLHIAVSPWGDVEVDGRPAGTTPPLNKLALPEGTHSVTIRNADFPPLQATVKISAGEPAVLKHRFGS